MNTPLDPIRLVGLIAVIAALTACAGPQQRLDAVFSADGTELDACVESFVAMDTAVQAAGVQDFGSYRVPGFPYLRTNRSLAALAPVESADTLAWIAQLAELDRQAREFEAGHLETRRMDAGKLDSCRARLLGQVARQPDLQAAILRNAEAPSSYSRGNRRLGAYPVIRPAIRRAIVSLKDEESAFFTTDPDSWRAPNTSWRVYTAAPGAVLPDVTVPDPVSLQLPAFGDARLKELVLQHAPVWFIAQAGDFDDIGFPTWNERGQPTVDSSRPSVFTRLSYARVGGRWLPQLNYTVWFSERPARRPLDPYAGRLDGVTWRVTLAEDGSAVAYDTMHNCGCYHMFFPPDGWKPRERLATEEPLWSPAAAPQPRPGERVALYLTSGKHYLRGVATQTIPADVTELEVVAAGALRSLPWPDGSRRSLFGYRGLVVGSQRLERAYLWPTGVRAAGSMRQWGHHATAFIGERHFDDPDLLDSMFEIPQ